MNTNELAKAYRHYISLLEKELEEVVPIAHTHGWKSKRFEAGEKARKRISELQGELKE